MRTNAHSEPPEGVIKGESVPVESEPDELNRSKVEEVMNQLKARGEPYTIMKRKELKEKAVELMRKKGMEVR